MENYIAALSVVLLFAILRICELSLELRKEKKKTKRLQQTCDIYQDKTTEIAEIACRTIVSTTLDNFKKLEHRQN